MLKNLIGAAIFVISVIVVMPIGSAPAFAQTCQQNCQAQYPGSVSDTFQTRARAQCIRACNNKKK
jgi:hypothetical protein